MNDGRPLIWVLEGQRAGDNAQAHELARRVGGRVESRRLRYNLRFRKTRNFVLGSSLVSLNLNDSDPLNSPWPDLVIGVGRRSVPVARWVRKQSGGKTKLVQIGRPRARLGIFDLIVTTPQYGLPKAPNVIELLLPITSELAASSECDEEWRKSLSSCPAPRIAIFVGGPMPPLSMRKEEATQLSMAAAALAKKLGGSLLVIGSPRTPPGLVEAMGSSLSVPHQIFPWAEGAPNPYRSARLMADRFIVTSDSVLMLTEALNTGKPVDVFRLPSEKRYRLPLHRWPFETLVRAGLLSTKRNVDAFVRRLISERHVRVLGGEEGVRIPPARNEDHVVARIRTLLER